MTDGDGRFSEQVCPVVVAGPSGAGKTTVCKRLLTGMDADQFLFSVSMTTRRPRPGEREGVDYCFVELDEFEALIETGGMFEHAMVHGQWYGTPWDNLERARTNGVHLLLDIDVQGARQVRAVVADVISIFVVPPTGSRIMEQLRGRGSESQDELARRIAGACAELGAAREFDYIVINDKLEEAVEMVRRIVNGRDIATGGPSVPESHFIANLIEELNQV